MTDSSRLLTLESFQQANARIGTLAVHTPLVPLRSPDGVGQLFLKDEGAQPIGSFKLRGALNMVAQLSQDALRRGVITFSSGNHAQGVAYAARAAGSRAVVVMPRQTPAVKRAATEALGAEVVFVDTTASAERRARAEALAAEHGYTVIPPYDHPAIIAGQGTCGLEILEDAPEVDLVLVPVSGGGLLSGVAAAIKHQRPEVRVVGVEPELAADALESFTSGKLATWPAELTGRTIADGLRTQSLGSLNFEHVRLFVDNIVLVSDAEIRAAMRYIHAETGLVAEPSGAATMAALVFHSASLLPYQRAVAVLSGRNVDAALLAEVLTER